MSRQTPYTPLGGGLDVVTPALQVPDGKMIAGTNFEPWIDGGYRRMRGWERYDGQPAPSDAVWTWLRVDDASSLTLGDTITGDTSGATGTLVYIDTETDLLVPNLAVTKVSGTFEAEDANTAAFSITAAQVGGAPNIDLLLEFRYAAQEEYRGDIDAVPGAGPVRGVWQIRDRVYAFRNALGNANGEVYKATSSGWDNTAVTLSEIMRFTAGTTEIEEGDTITGGTSGATGTVHRVAVHIGDYGTNDAAGFVTMLNVTGTFVDGEAMNVSASSVATTSGSSEPFQLPPGGRYAFTSANFLAGADTYRMYGANGVGPAFEIDENDVLSPILLDLTLGDSPTDNDPYLVQEFGGALWLMFPGGSVQRSVTGLPLTFNGFLGAAEFGLGEEGTALVNSAGKVLIVSTRRQTFGFFPLDAGGYQQRLISDRAGCILYSAQELDTVLSLDDAGIIDNQRAETFGDFANATVSGPVQPILFRNHDRLAGSYVVKETNQYRLLFTDGTGVISRKRMDGRYEFATFNMQLTNENLQFATTCEDENTKPTYWACGESGYVYSLEKGNNCDGDEMESFLRLPFNHQGAPAVRKRYRLALVDIVSQDRLLLLCGQERDFSAQGVRSSTWEDTALSRGAFYDIDNWDESYWDAGAYDYARFELRGSGTNLSLILYHKSAKIEPFILQGLILHYDPRRVYR